MTFEQWLRARSDGELRAVLAVRPDLIHPVPSDLAALAARASSQGSVARALDRLDRFELQVVEALAVLPEPAAQRDLVRALGVEAGDPDVTKAVGEALDSLRGLAVVWSEDEDRAPDGDPAEGRRGERAAGAAPDGDTRHLRVVAAVRTLVPAAGGLGPAAVAAFRDYPAERLAGLLADLGLSTAEIPSGQVEAREALAALLADPRRVQDLLDHAGPESTAALHRLVWGPPTGRVDDARRVVRIDSAASPIERLLARGLLAAADERTVVLPREVALRLRGGRVFHSADADPPPLAARPHEPDLVDRTAGGQAFAAPRSVADLLEMWGVDPPGVLRTGGLGVRDLRRAARVLDVEEWVAALYVEVAWAAGLLAASGTVDGEWLPTKAYDVWRARPTQQRWAALATAWRATTRVPGLVGERDDHDKPLNALAPSLTRVHAAYLRADVLAALAAAPHGASPEADAVRARIDWQHPRRAGQHIARMVGWALREAEALGVTGLGALSSPGRALLAEPEGEADGGGGAAAEALEPLLPEMVDHVLLQADLTAVAPGPLTQELASELALAASVESTGGATVYRFTDASVRNALDAGRSADDLVEFLERHSRTPVPQPLRYLVVDAARRHGRIRVGAASAYLRCDDPATLSELLADRRAASLRLHRLAPTVLASRTSRGALLDGLRSLGYAPVAESPDGAMVISRADARRTEGRREVPEAPRPQAPEPPVVDAAVRALRAGDAAARSGVLGASAAAVDGAPPRTSTASAMEALRHAVAEGQRVWIGYLDTQGRPSSRIVDPVRVEGGYLTAYDTTRASVHRFALHRVTGVSVVERSAS